MRCRLTIYRLSLLLDKLQLIRLVHRVSRDTQQRVEGVCHALDLFYPLAIDFTEMQNRSVRRTDLYVTQKDNQHVSSEDSHDAD